MSIKYNISEKPTNNEKITMLLYKGSENNFIDKYGIENAIKTHKTRALSEFIDKIISDDDHINKYNSDNKKTKTARDKKIKYAENKIMSRIANSNAYKPSNQTNLTSLIYP